MKFRFLLLETLLLVSVLHLVAGSWQCTDSCPRVAALYQEIDDCTEHTFKATNKGLSFDEARGACFEMGGDLITTNIGPEGLEYHHEIRRLASRYSCMWVGYTDRNKEGTWRFLDGKPYNAGDRSQNAASYWQRGEPNNSGGNEDCAMIWHHGTQMNDGQCGHSCHGLCEIPVCKSKCL